MVHVIRNGKDFFLSQKYNKIFCFGAGKILYRFLNDCTDIRIEAVIDNFRKTEPDSKDGLRIINYMDFLNSYQSGTVVVITTQYYMDILRQLDEEALLNNLTCYIYPLWDGDSDYIETIYEKISNSRNTSKAKKKENANRFQIWHCMNEGYNAGAKAPCDLYTILNECGFQQIPIHTINAPAMSKNYEWQKNRNDREWSTCLNLLDHKSVLLVQHLLAQSQAETAENVLKIKKEKKIKIITFIHDIEKVRLVCNTPKMVQEFDALLKYTDVFIVHNETMKEYFKSQGIPDDRIICLGIFDYLFDGATPIRRYSTDLIIAGNFEPSKSGYTCQLGKLPNISFHLFGKGFSGDIPCNVIHHGSFPADEIPNLLPDGFGLIWDGPDLDTCSGNTGKYLRYNNPHKLSLYLVSGLPVIVWAESAVKDFIVNNGLGFAVKSLYELNTILAGITEEQYNYYLRNVKLFSIKIRKGEYTRQALKKALAIIDSLISNK